MKIVIKMTKDRHDHKSFKITIPHHTVKTSDIIIEKMTKKTGVPWKVVCEAGLDSYGRMANLVIESGDLTRYFRKNFPEDEKAYVNWRMSWKNKEFEIATGK